MAFRIPYHRNNFKKFRSSNFSTSLPILVIFLLVIDNLKLTQLKTSTSQNAQIKDSYRFNPYPQIRIFKYIGSVSEFNKPNDPIPKVELFKFAYINKKFNRGLARLYNNELKTDFSTQGSHSSFSPTVLAVNPPVISQILLNEYIYLGYHTKRLEKYTNRNCIPKASISMSKLPYMNRNCQYQRFDLTKYIKDTNFNPNDIKQSMINRIMGFFGKIFDIIKVILQGVGMWLNNTIRDILSNQVHSYEHRTYTNHSELDRIKLHSAKSPGNMIQPSKFIMAFSFLMMLPFASTSSAVPAVSPPAQISEQDKNKFKIIHTLNTVGRLTLLSVYRYYKKFPDSQNIKDYLINVKGWTEAQFKKEFNDTLINVITSTDASGNDYDISLLIKCLRVLCEGHLWKNWQDDRQLECRCQKLADKRNQVFHSFSGISISNMKKEHDTIERLITNILNSLKKRFPKKSSEIDITSKDFNDRITYIFVQPLGESEIKSCLHQKNVMFLKDLIPSYKIESKKEWGKFNILDFLLGNISTYEIKLLFTEIVVVISDIHNKMVSINYKEIMNYLTKSSILLIESVTGGGKTTLLRYGINDWGEGGLIMNTSGYDYIFPMVFRNPVICSVKDLIVELIPKASVEIGSENIMKYITDPSLNILFFCDGFDEKNANSKKLFNEICHLKSKYPHVKVLVTTRPESFMEFQYLLSSTKIKIKHMKILGIHESKRSEFLRRYHNELINAGISKQNTDDLLQFYNSQSARHRDLYKLPLNLVILAYLWSQDPNKVVSIKSAAGLYTEIMNISKEKLKSRICKSYPDVMTEIHGDVSELCEMIDRFKEILYSESLIALRFDRIFIDDSGTKRIKNECKNIGLPYIEIKGSYLLSKLNWVNGNTIEEVLEVAHKGFLDFYAAKCIEVILLQTGKSISSILLEYHENDPNLLDIRKYQNVLQILGGLLALKDDSLVEKYGQEIINLLVESGVRNNSQWYEVFSDVNSNPNAPTKFGKLIAHHLKLEDFHVKDSDVEVVTPLIPFLEIDKVTLDINGTVMPNHLSTMIDAFKAKKCHLEISKIEDEQIEIWEPILTLNDDIIISNVSLKQSYNISPLHCCQNTIVSYYLEQYWKQLIGPAPDMSKMLVRRLWAAVDTTDSLPPKVEVLRLGILIDPATGRACDPGIGRLTLRCKRLSTLGVHVRAGTPIEHFPPMPNVKYSHLYLSMLKSNSDICWAAKTAKTLQPTRRSYMRLILPSCKLNEDQVRHLVLLLKHEGVTIKHKGGVYIQSTLGHWQCKRLKSYTLDNLKCDLYRYVNDDELSLCKFCSW